jgi:hypothetical protein
VEECHRALGTPGWYAESLKLVWEAAGVAGGPEARQLPPLPEYLAQCIRHWQELHQEGRKSEPTAAPGATRNGVRGQAVAV